MPKKKSIRRKNPLEIKDYLELAYSHGGGFVPDSLMLNESHKPREKEVNIKNRISVLTIGNDKTRFTGDKTEVFTPRKKTNQTRRKQPKTTRESLRLFCQMY